MGVFQRLKEKVGESIQRRRDDSDRIRVIQIEAEQQERIEFESQLREELKKAGLIRAKSEAEKKSGISKLRALDKVARMEKGPMTSFSTHLRRFSEFTSKNRENTERRKELTEKRMATAKQMKIERMTGNKRTREDKKAGIRQPRRSEVIGRKPFTPTGFKGVEPRVIRKPFEPRGFGR